MVLTVAAPDVHAAARNPADVLVVDRLHVTLRDRDAVTDVSFVLPAGRTLALVGESGCGKSLTCLAIAGLLAPPLHASGSVRLAGRELLGLDDAALAGIRGRQVAMITQDPMAALNPVMTVGAQIAEAMTLHGATRSAAWAEARRLLDRVGIADAAARLRSHPHTLSGGTAQRVAIAIALACHPRLLLADEPTTALDVTIQAQILDLLRDAQRELGMALLLVTHDLGVVAEMADDVAVMYAGQLVERAPAAVLFDRPAHPYTAGLLDCAPRIDGAAVLQPIPGAVPAIGDMPDGCRFRPRCGHAVAQCRQAQRLANVAAAHAVACCRPLRP